MQKLLILIFGASVFIACAEKQREAPEKAKVEVSSLDTLSTTQDVSIGNPTLNPVDTTGNEEKYMDDISKKIKDIEANELVRILPVSIPGTEKIPPDIGSVADGDKDYAVVSASYRYPDGSITIDITDYTSSRFIPSEIRTSLEQMPPVENGIILGKIQQDGFWGFNYFNEKMKAGNIRLIIAGRFFVQINYENVPQSFTDVIKIINLLKIKTMMKYK